MLLIVAVAFAAMSCGNKCCDKKCCQDTCCHQDTVEVVEAEAAVKKKRPFMGRFLFLLAVCRSINL